MKTREYIKKLLSENRFSKQNDEQYRSCYISDLYRMELIEYFFRQVDIDSGYNVSLPNLSKLIDDYDGYDDQVYIQNNLKENEIIFWEGWVKSCWDAAIQKDEYQNLDKKTIIEKIINERFPRIAAEFNLNIKDYNYFIYKGKYIMKIIFQR